MKQIKIFDTTLRDGEQSAGVSLNSFEKLEIAKKLAELKVDIIEVGFPYSNKDDFYAATEIAKQVHGPIICDFARLVKDDIDSAYEAVKYSKNPRIHVFIATSQIHLEKKFKKSQQEILEIIKKGICYVKQKGVEIEFSPEDASRTEESYLIETIRTAVESGASIINIADTVGYSQPDEFYHRVKNVHDFFGEDVAGNKFQLSVHCHNDLGNAVANTLAGIRAGATQVECTINGIGERTGNASLEEVVMNLDARKNYFNAFTQIDISKLYETSNLVSALTKIPIPINKPIVGANAFSHESGIHQHGVKADRRTYEIIDPEKIGWKGERFVIGKHSGKKEKEAIGIK